MKKLSIILALIMALSCFGVVASAAPVYVPVDAEDAAEPESSTSEVATTAVVEVPDDVSTTVADTTVADTTVADTTVADTTVADTTVAPTTAAPTTAAPTTTVKTTAAPATVEITVILEKVDGSEEVLVFNGYDALVYEVAAGKTITDEAIVAAVKARLDDQGNALIDTEEYIISDTVLAEDVYGLYAFSSCEAKSGEVYEFVVCAAEINDVANLAVTIGEQLGKYNWSSITKFQVALINQIINGCKGAIESLANAEWPTGEDKADAEATTAEAAVEETEAIAETPDTGVSAVAGAAVVVLALSATTAVVLRKKED